MNPTPTRAGLASPAPQPCVPNWQELKIKSKTSEKQGHGDIGNLNDMTARQANSSAGPDEPCSHRKQGEGHAGLFQEHQDSKGVERSNQAAA